MELTRMTKKIIIWLGILTLVATAGYFVWRHYNGVGADVLKPTNTVPLTVSFFGKVSVENNAVPLGNVVVYAGSTGMPVRSNGEFNLQLSRSTWLIASGQYSSEIPVSFISRTGQRLAIKGLSEPFTLKLPPEWSASGNYVKSNNGSYIASPFFSVRANFVLSSQ